MPGRTLGLLRAPLPLRHALSVALACLTLATAAGLAPPADATAPSRSKIYFGVAGSGSTAAQRSTTSLARHSYGYFEGKVPSARMLSVRFQSNQSWRTTAALSPSSSGYKHIVRWADTIKGRGGEVLVAFHGEPESTSSARFGSAAEFKAAYRKVVQIFRSRGARNVAFTWQMTAYAFRADPGEHNYAPAWYPGDKYVDVVGPDPYNWFTCGHGRGRWMSLESLTVDAMRFARQHGKQLAIAEFASVRDPRRPEWITEAGAWLAAHDNIIVAAFYFDRPPTNSANSDCTWPLRTDADYKAFNRVANRSEFHH